MVNINWKYWVVWATSSSSFKISNNDICPKQQNVIFVLSTKWDEKELFDVDYDEE